MKKRYVLIYSLIILILLALVVLNICTGSMKISASELIRIIMTHDANGTAGRIIWEIRLPRIMAAIFLGGALALSGYLLQTFFSNPIAGPFVLGISSGAKLVVAMLMVTALKYGFAIHSVYMVIAAFIGSMIATGFVLIASKKLSNMATLIVCGIMTGYICSAVTELLISFAEDSNIVNLHNWSMGSFSAIAWKDVACFSVIVIAGFLLSVFMTKNMEAFSFGQEFAQSVGVNVKVFKIMLILVSSILSATVTAFAGPVSFVGIAVPHIIRVLMKSAKPQLIVPAVFLGGSIFCLFSDFVARYLFAPTELSISTITAVIGAPVVIWLLLSKNRNGNRA